MATVAADEQRTGRASLPANGTEREMVDAIKSSFEHHVKYSLAKDQYTATDHDR